MQNICRVIDGKVKTKDVETLRLASKYAKAFAAMTKGINNHVSKDMAFRGNHLNTLAAYYEAEEYILCLEWRD